MSDFLYTSAMPVVTKIVGNFQVSTKGSRDILQQAKGITLIESTKIRWFSR
jgi:hypothetical protein